MFVIFFRVEIRNQVNFRGLLERQRLEISNLGILKKLTNQKYCEIPGTL